MFSFDFIIGILTFKSLKWNEHVFSFAWTWIFKTNIAITQQWKIVGTDTGLFINFFKDF